jgi:DNA-directed RNA polymerase subunit RPC12/RpoP
MDREKRKEYGIYCPMCGSKEIYFTPSTWTKSGYTQCQKCKYRLSSTEVSHQKHYLRNIKAIDKWNQSNLINLG